MQEEVLSHKVEKQFISQSNQIDIWSSKAAFSPARKQHHI